MYTTRAHVQHEPVRLEGTRARSVFFGFACCLSAVAFAEPMPASPVVPPHNRADLSEPPPRPAASDAEAKARILFDAIVHDAPDRAQSVFFPRDAFLLVKDLRDPGKYFDRLKRRFADDIHSLHAALPDPKSARFERFELATRGGFVRVREEGNRLPYWASRHSYLYYRSGAAGARAPLLRLEVRVWISWDDRWYVIHLNEFR